MTTLPSDAIRNVVILGHKGSGKTSLIEAALYVAKATPKLGKLGDRASGLDDTSQERAHMTTLETRVSTLKWSGKKVNLIDTPGEASFHADTRLAMAAADAAIVCVSAKDGVETGTERALRCVHELKLPFFVVLTKVDDENAKVDETIAAMRANLNEHIAVMEVLDGVGSSFKGIIAVRTGKAWIGKPEGPQSLAPIPVPPESTPMVADARAHLVDEVAGTDDALADHYLTDGDLSQDELDSGTRKAVAARKLVLLYEVASTVPGGIVALLDGIADLAPPPSSREPFRGKSGPNGAPDETRAPTADAPLAALVFKTHIDPHAGRMSYARVLSGVLRADASLVSASTGHKERAAQLLQGTPKELKPIAEAVAGDIVAVTKLKTTRTGETLSDEKRPFVADVPPRPLALYSRALIVEGKGMEDKAAAAIHRLVEEDPGLVFSHDAQSRDMLLSGLGALQLEITVERLRQRANIDCKLGPPRVQYRETIRGRVKNVEGKQKKQTGGHGQFGVCYVDLEPLARGGGFEFEDAIVGGVIPRQFIPSVEKGVRRAMEQGVLAGYPITDVKVRLVDGKTHSVDSSDAAFQVAGFRAFRAAMVQAQPAILEPIAKLEVSVPGDLMGDVIGDLNSRHGKVMGTDTVGDMSVITAFVPLAATLDYEPKLTSMTSGRGTFVLTLDHYDYCSAQTQEKVIKESGFKLAADED